MFAGKGSLGDLERLRGVSSSLRQIPAGDPETGQLRFEADLEDPREPLVTAQEIPRLLEVFPGLLRLSEQQVNLTCIDVRVDGGLVVADFGGEPCSLQIERQGSLQVQ